LPSGDHANAWGDDLSTIRLLCRVTFSKWIPSAPEYASTRESGRQAATRPSPILRARVPSARESHNVDGSHGTPVLQYASERPSGEGCGRV